MLREALDYVCRHPRTYVVSVVLLTLSVLVLAHRCAA